MVVSSVARRGASTGSASPRTSPRNHVIAGVVLAVLLVVLGLLVHNGWGPLADADRQLTDAADSVSSNSSFSRLLQDWSGTFTPGFATAACITLAVALLFTRRIVLAVAIAVAALLGDRLASWLPTVVSGPAPVSSSRSVVVASTFPSQHAFAAALGCGLFMLALLSVIRRPGVRWALGTLLVVIALFTVYGRVAMAGDRPSAVVGGVLLGLLVTVVVAGVGTTARSGWHRLRR